MKKILIVDDSLFMRKVLKDILSQDYKIVEADSGKIGLEQFNKEKPDLVLLDIIMPEGEEEGLKVLREIKETSPAAAVVMITAVGQDAVMEECKRLGARDYLVKPFKEDQVTRVVEKYLS